MPHVCFAGNIGANGKHFGNQHVSRKRSKYYSQAKPISGLLAKILNPVVRKRGLAGADLVMAWRDIAGPQFAECTMPDRIIWPKMTAQDDQNGASPGTLVVRCAGPAAVLLQHEAPLIAERVNTFLGWYAVERIKIAQGSIHLPSGNTIPTLPEVPPEKQLEVQNQIAGVKDDQLRDALASLGTKVAARAIADRKPE